MIDLFFEVLLSLGGWSRDENLLWREVGGRGLKVGVEIGGVEILLVVLCGLVCF